MSSIFEKHSYDIANMMYKELYEGLHEIYKSFEKNY